MSDPAFTCHFLDAAAFKVAEKAASRRVNVSATLVAKEKV